MSGNASTALTDSQRLGIELLYRVCVPARQVSKSLHLPIASVRAEFRRLDTEYQRQPRTEPVRHP